MSSERGNNLQRALADYLRAWFPDAESTPNGRPGTDVLGTPGIVWENKTPRRFDPHDWAAQAAGHASCGELPVGVYWPDKVGQRRPQLAIGLIPLPLLMDLLVAAGWAPKPVNQSGEKERHDAVHRADRAGGRVVHRGPVARA